MILLSVGTAIVGVVYIGNGRHTVFGKCTPKGKIKGVLMSQLPVVKAKHNRQLVISGPKY